MFHAHKLAMEQGRGRPTSCLIKDRPTTMTPKAGVEPGRRSQEHVRVDPSAGHDHNRCSRHQSPPPSTHSDSHSRCARPGPREGRAGSPIPSAFLSDEEDEDEDDDGMEAEVAPEDDSDLDMAARSPNIDTAIEDDESSDPSPAPHTPAAVAASLGNGVRSILRRASEHLPGFRPSFSGAPPDAGTTTAPIAVAVEEQRQLGRAKSLGSRPTRPAEPLLSSAEATALAPSRPITCPKPRQDQFGLKLDDRR